MVNTLIPVLQAELDSIRKIREEALRLENMIERTISNLEQQALMSSSDRSNMCPAAMSVWRPSFDEIVADPDFHKIKIIKSRHVNEQSIAARLILHIILLKEFYRKYLKKYRVIRLVVPWIWRRVFHIYVTRITMLFRNRNAKRWRTLTKLGQIAKRHDVLSYKLFDVSYVKMSAPKVSPSQDEVYLMSARDVYEIPEIIIAVINKGQVFGGSNLVVTDKTVVCHDLYDFNRDSTSEELHGRIQIDPGSSCIRWLSYDESPVSVPVAATFIDACAANYAHWMTEVLPRIVLLSSEESFNNIPIIINDGLHKNIMQSLFHVVGAEREIIMLPVGCSLVVDKLYVTSATGYVPFDQRTNKLSGHSHGLFSPYAIDLLRKKFDLLDFKCNKEKWPEKIYLRRNSGTRKVMNAIEVEEYLISIGYLIVEPEKLSFIQQVQLFRNVRFIVSPTGAALSNAIFCRPRAKVVVLMGKHENMIYRYWCNMLMPIDIDVSYVLGNIDASQKLGIHSDFFVNLDDVKSLLKAMEGI